MMESVTDKQVLRFKFLHKLYEIAESQESPFIDGSRIAEAIGASEAEAERICSYLEGEGLIRNVVENGLVIEILHAGIKEIETALGAPDRGTEHFPPPTIVINTGMVVNQSVSGERNITTAASNPQDRLAGDWMQMLHELSEHIHAEVHVIDQQNDLLDAITLLQAYLRDERAQ